MNTVSLAFRSPVQGLQIVLRVTLQPLLSEVDFNCHWSLCGPAHGAEVLTCIGKNQRP